LIYSWPGGRTATVWIATGTAAGELAAAVGLAMVVGRTGPQVALNGLVRVDALSAFMVLVIAAVGLLATAALRPTSRPRSAMAGRATDRGAALPARGRHFWPR